MLYLDVNSPNLRWLSNLLGWWPFLFNFVYLLQYGYAIIDLEKLDPVNVDDLRLSQYLAYVLQVYTKLDIFFWGL